MSTVFVKRGVVLLYLYADQPFLPLLHSLRFPLPMHAQTRVQEVQQKEEEIRRMGEGIQQRDMELGRKEDELRQKEGEKQTLQSHAHQLEVS